MTGLSLDPSAIDNGMTAFALANKILICSAAPTSYAQANTLALGNKSFGAGHTFGAPVTAGNGRKVSSAPVTDGSVTATGFPACWAVIDDANARLLATGPITGAVAVQIGMRFSLGSIAIDLPGFATFATQTLAAASLSDAAPSFGASALAINGAFGTPGWSTLKLGGGGYVVGLDIASDGTYFARPDTYTCYRMRPGETVWTDLITLTSMPAGWFGYQPPTGANESNLAGNCYEICPAPSDPNTVYVALGTLATAQGEVFKSTDQGDTWSATNFVNAVPLCQMTINTTDRLSGRRMAVDPVDPNKLLLATHKNGLWQTLDGGVTWSEITGVPHCAGTSLATQIITVGGVGGVPHVGDILSLVFTSSAVAGSPLTVSYTIQSSDTFATAGAALRAAVNATTALSSIGLSAFGTGAAVEITQPLVNPQVATTSAVSGTGHTTTFKLSDPADWWASLILFDTFSGTVVVGGTTVTKNVYVFSNGNGLYASTDGGVTWGPCPGGTPNRVVQWMIMGAGGMLWMTERQASGGTLGFIWTYSGSGTGGAWVKLTAQGALYSGIAYNPKNGKVVALQQNGPVNIFNGTSWTGVVTNYVRGAVRPQPEWLSWSGQFMSYGGCMFDPTQPDLLVAGDGTGLWLLSNPPTDKSAFVWQCNTSGIEELCAQSGVCFDGIASLGVQDFGTFTADLSIDEYPTKSSSCYGNSEIILVGSDIDYCAGNPDIQVSRVQKWLGGTNFSGYSLDRGRHWYPFNSWYAGPPGDGISASCVSDSGVPNGLSGSAAGNKVLVTLPAGITTAGLVTWSGAGSPVNSIISVLNISVPGGNAYTRAPTTISNCYYVTVTGPQTFILEGSTWAPALAATGNYIFYVDTNPVTDDLGTYGITNIFTDAFGQCGLSLGQRIFNGAIVQVTGAGPSSNGYWIATNNITLVLPYGISLLGSVFLDDWTGGGVCETALGGGGCIGVDQSGTTIIQLPSYNQPPYYSPDMGKTWSRLDLPGVLNVANQGWAYSYFVTARVIAADRVNPDIFYIYNMVHGTYKVVGGVGTLQSSTLLPGALNCTLKSVEGHSGHLLLIAGSQGAGTGHPAAKAMMWSGDGGKTWAAVPGTLEPLRVDVGATLSGALYPTVYYLGWATVGTTSVGVWSCSDVAIQVGGVWQVNPTPTLVKVTDYAGGSQDGAACIIADKLAPGVLIVGHGGSGFKKFIPS